MLNLEINNQYSRLDSPETSTLRLFGILRDSHLFPITDGELSVVFVDDTQIGQIHRDFMGDPSPTDVITFPANHSMESAGEIIVSVDHACNLASELDEPFSRELSLYLIHGWLHLAGYDDREEVDRTKMREAEKIALGLIDNSEARVEFKLK